MLFVNTLISQFLVLFLWRVVMSMRKISIPILWSFHPQLSSSIFRTYCGTRNRRYQHPTKFSNIFSPSHYCVTGKFWWRNCSQFLNSYRMTIFFRPTISTCSKYLNIYYLMSSKKDYGFLNYSRIWSGVINQPVYLARIGWGSIDLMPILLVRRIIIVSEMT